MLHHYNYSSPLSHFLGQFPGAGLATDDSVPTEEGSASDSVSTRYPGAGTPGSGPAASKSFTIAAILGLKPDGHANDVQATPTDLTVVNLSVHQGVTECRSRQVRQGIIPTPQNVYQRHPTTPCHRQHNQNKKSPGQCPTPNGGKSKRVRTIFTPEQLERLEAEFERQQYMVGPERLYLAHTLQLTEAQVKVWFQNRRIKWRKHHLEVTQQRLAAIKQRQLMAVATTGQTDSTDVVDGEDTGSDTDT